jgi:DNA-binding LacI/PurR family transcriptional regulator
MGPPANPGRFNETLETQAIKVLSERGVDGIVWFPIRDVNTAGALIADIPTIVVGADLIALGVMRHVQSTGRRIPEDLSLVGFDDIPWAQMSSPSLTTIEMPIDDMAVEAVEGLLRRIESNLDLRRRVIFDVNLVARGSSAAIHL